MASIPSYEIGRVPRTLVGVNAEGGWVTLSEQPGLGIELDEAMLARTASSAATFD